MSLTPEAKKLLAETIRGTARDPEKGIRGRLLRALHDEADRRYRLSVPLRDAGLDEIHSRRRERIETWVDERVRAAKPKNTTECKATAERLLAQAEKEAAATLLNRLVLLRHLEALGFSKPAVVTGGWSSKGYRELRDFAPALCTNGTTDATEGYGALLQLVFDELAVDLPGLFGDVGLTRLFPVPAATLREVIERLDAPGLASAWTDDTTLGWVYQYWNDPDREALDAKINGGGKIEPHEIASKTQMFTERYMVEWLLQNSLGLTWLAMCKKHGWTPDADRALPGLDARRADWRTKRDASEVALDALMPIEGELEEHWKYYVPQPIPDDAVDKAPESVRAIKILDPACGSGHFLVIAFGLLVALYREEAKHLGTEIADKAIAESILENNLHGIDIDPRAIQIAAAGLYLKAKALAKTARPKTLHLVAPVLQLGNLPQGPPPSDDKTEKRHANARYVMDLDDGVMVNSAALWPLLEPQWKEPKKWWKELANAQGKKDYDWSHLAARYFPDRVRKKCHDDPSLAVAHTCFWELHPAKADAWELRLQDELRPDFTIDEPASDEARAKFLKDHDRESREILAKEHKRREKKSAKADDADAEPLFDPPGDEGDDGEAEGVDA